MILHQLLQFLSFWIKSMCEGYSLPWAQVLTLDSLSNKHRCKDISNNLISCVLVRSINVSKHWNIKLLENLIENRCNIIYTINSNPKTNACSFFRFTHTKITLGWAHSHFTTRVHTLFYFLHDITTIDDNKNDDLQTSTRVSLIRLTLCWWRHSRLLMTSQMYYVPV